MTGYVSNRDELDRDLNIPNNKNVLGVTKSSEPPAFPGDPAGASIYETVRNIQTLHRPLGSERTRETEQFSLSSKSTPISLMTIHALKDLGYSVNEGAADPFNLSGP